MFVDEIEIFISGQPFLSFMRPATKLNTKEVKNLSPLQDAGSLRDF